MPQHHAMTLILTMPPALLLNYVSNVVQSKAFALCTKAGVKLQDLIPEQKKVEELIRQRLKTNWPEIIKEVDPSCKHTSDLTERVTKISGQNWFMEYLKESHLRTHDRMPVSGQILVNFVLAQWTIQSEVWNGMKLSGEGFEVLDLAMRVSAMSLLEKLMLIALLQLHRADGMRKCLRLTQVNRMTKFAFRAWTRNLN